MNTNPVKLFSSLAEVSNILQERKWLKLRMMVPEGSRTTLLVDCWHKRRLCKEALRFASDLCASCNAFTFVDLTKLFSVLFFSQQDPGYANFLYEQLHTPGTPELDCCHACSTPLHQLRQEALQTLHSPVLTFSSDTTAMPSASFLPQPSRLTVSSSSVHAKQLLKNQPRSLLPLRERHKVPDWSQNPSASSGSKTSVQVTVAGGQLTGSLSTVTIQAQQYLDGMWSISRVNNFLHQPKLVCPYLHFYFYAWIMKIMYVWSMICQLVT